VTEAIQALDGRVVASEFFPFTGGAVSTSLSWLHYMMAGVQKERWLGLRLSPYGCTETTLQKSLRLCGALPRSASFMHISKPTADSPVSLNASRASSS
jgi:hypothetical protein